ncbi:cold-shock' DNA-binding domain-containing protein [Chytridium lagenaria]|nr:cold-shock' DNA-binding domain-containing protein [Chytridium lagenaria]
MTSLSISSNPNGTAGDCQCCCCWKCLMTCLLFKTNLMPNHHLKTPPPLRPRSSSDAVSSALDTDSHSKTYMGTVKFFNSQKGYGFIIPDDMSNLEVFVHHSAITKPKSGFRSLAEGEIVEFEMVQGDKGFQAANVTGPNGVDVQGDPHAYLYMMSNMLPPQNHHSPSFHPIHNYPLPTSPRDGPMRPPSGSQYGGSNTGREPQRMPSPPFSRHGPHQQRPSSAPQHSGGMVGAYYPQPHPSSNTHLHRSASSSSSYASSVTAPSPSPSLSSPPTIHSMSGVPSSGSASVGSSAAGEQPQRHSKHRGHRQHQSGASLSHPPTQEMVYPGAVQGPQYYYPDQYRFPPCTPSPATAVPTATGAPVQYYAAPYPFYGTPQMPPPPPMPMSQQQQQSYVGPSPRRQSRQQRGVQQQGGQMGGQ